ncbi:hypothetical protein O181_046536, partial [Austropuccinia psidii MF-1]|nr:hypothetical protein [Austropuccinia psidii MF-1]
TKLHYSNSRPQIHHPFQRKTSHPFSLAIPGSYQKSIQGPQPPGPAGVGLQTRSKARAQAVLTPSPRAPLDGTPEGPQLRAQLDRGPIMEGEAPFRKEGRGPRTSNSFSGIVGRFPGTSRTIFRGPGEDGTGGPTLAQSNQPVSHQSEPSLLAIMQKKTQIMANLQEDSSSDSLIPSSFKTLSMKAPECFDGTQPFKVRSFIQSCQLIFHNDPVNFSQDMKKVLCATSVLIGSSAKWIEPYLSNLTNQDPNYLLNSWKLFECQLFTLFGDLNEVRKAEVELGSLRMKEGGHVMYHYKLLISEVWSQELGIGLKQIASTISGRNCHPSGWISWPPILQELTLFKT